MTLIDGPTGHILSYNWQPDRPHTSHQSRPTQYQERCGVCKQLTSCEYLIWVSSPDLLRPRMVPMWLPGHDDCVPGLRLAWETELQQQQEYAWMVIL